MNSIWVLLTWNYVTSLSIEVIIKIKRPLNTNYAKRMKIYHIVSFALTILEIIIAEIVGSFGVTNLYTCLFKDNSNAEYIYFFIIFGNLPVMWTSIILVAIDKNRLKNNALRQLALVIFSMTITWGMPTFSPLIRIMTGKYSTGFDYFSMFCGCISGITLFFSRFSSLKLLIKFKNIFKFCQKEQRPATKSVLNNSLLLDYSLGSYFENITENTIKSMILGSSLVYLSGNSENCCYSYSYKKKKHLFNDSHLQKLREHTELNIEGIEENSLEIWEYEPEVFAGLRRFYHKDKNSMITSLMDPKNLEEVFNSNKGGRSNAFIFNTKDEALLLKTITHEEKYLLLCILHKYYKRITNHPDSRIVRIFGLFKLNSSKHSFIIMENIIKSRSNALIFDLKGSLDNRYVKAANHQGIILKDQNLIELNQSVRLPPEIKSKIINSLIEDTKFFNKLDIIDYSLIIAFYSKDANAENSYFIKGSEEVSYSFGIIDFLQLFTFQKKMELIYKKAKCKKNLSVSPPKKYATRFISFIKHIFI